MKTVVVYKNVSKIIFEWCIGFEKHGHSSLHKRCHDGMKLTKVASKMHLVYGTFKICLTKA